MWQLLLRTLASKAVQRSSLLRLVKTQGRNIGGIFTTNASSFTKVDRIINVREYLRKGILSARNKPGFIEQWRRLATKENFKGAFRTLGKDYIKNQFRTAMRNLRQIRRMYGVKGLILDNLPGLFKDMWDPKRGAGSVFSDKYSHPVSDARSIEKDIVRRLVTNQRRVIDSSPLSSSWCHHGVWIASSSQQDYWTGILYLTVKHEKIRNGKIVSVRIGKTYPVHNFSLAVWSLMKAAMGREGTGAGSVYIHSHLRGMRTGRQVAASKWSSQVV